MYCIMSISTSTNSNVLCTATFIRRLNYTGNGCVQYIHNKPFISFTFHFGHNACYMNAVLSELKKILFSIIIIIAIPILPVALVR